MLDVGRLANIGLNPDDARLGRLANSRNRFFKRLRSASDYGDIGARGREPRHHRKADPFAAASARRAARKAGFPWSSQLALGHLSFSRSGSMLALPHDDSNRALSSGRLVTNAAGSHKP